MSGASRAGWLARAAIVGGCLLYALVATGNGLDRIAASNPARAALVPDAFASRSLALRGGAAVAAGDTASAITLGERLVRADPLDPSAAALLGAGWLLAGDAAGAEAAFRIAGQLGWRVPLTQRYWLARAVELGDWRVAAQRLDALLRQQPELTAQPALLDPFEASPQGRAELLARMALRPDWLSRYASDVADLTPDRLARRSALLIDLAGNGITLGCGPAGSVVLRQVMLGAVADARHLWRAQCGGSDALVADPTFARASLSEAPSPFDWAIGSGGDLDLDFSASSGPRALTLRGPVRFAQPVASQLLVLAPGRYRLQWRSGAGVEAALSCQRDKPSPLAARFDPASRRWQAEATVDAACPGHWLVFSLRPGVAADSLAEISLDSLQGR